MAPGYTLTHLGVELLGAKVTDEAADVAGGGLRGCWVDHKQLESKAPFASAGMSPRKNSRSESLVNLYKFLFAGIISGAYCPKRTGPYCGYPVIRNLGKELCQVDPDLPTDENPAQVHCRILAS